MHRLFASTHAQQHITPEELIRLAAIWYSMPKAAVGYFPFPTYHMCKFRKEYSQCAICLDDMAAPMRVARLRCRHAFHEQCIAKWLQTSQTCPVCRFVT